MRPLLLLLQLLLTRDTPSKGPATIAALSCILPGTVVPTPGATPLLLLLLLPI
jgi:hypothetical protein